MAKILVHVTAGPNDPTKAALAFLVAKSALEEGHDVSLFVAGDGVHLLTREVSKSLEGLGTGRLADHFDSINAAKAVVFFSGMSAKARNIAAEAIVLNGAQPAMPNRLVQLAVEADTVLCY